MSRPWSLLAICLIALVACGDDDANEAVRRGVGDSCADNADCTEEGQECLTEFRGGMCGIADCETSDDCPEGSVCVADPDFTRNYCLLTCVDKPDCNARRAPEVESNCTSTLNAIDVRDGGVEDPKVCRPPSGE